MKLFMQDGYDEPSNQELGIKPWNKWFCLAVWIAFGLICWAALGLAVWLAVTYGGMNV